VFRNSSQKNGSVQLLRNTICTLRKLRGYTYCPSAKLWRLQFIFQFAETRTEKEKKEIIW
jgi:hypothetical protein